MGLFAALQYFAGGPGDSSRQAATARDVSWVEFRSQMLAAGEVESVSVDVAQELVVAKVCGGQSSCV
jgi:hypothetical protein